MKEMHLLMEKTGMSAAQLRAAFEQIMNPKQKERAIYHDPIVAGALGAFDWSAPDADWRWMTATEALALYGIKEPSRALTTGFGSELKNINKSKRRRSNGKTLLFIPPLKK